MNMKQAEFRYMHAFAFWLATILLNSDSCVVLVNMTSVLCKLSLKLFSTHFSSLFARSSKVICVRFFVRAENEIF